MNRLVWLKDLRNTRGHWIRTILLNLSYQGIISTDLGVHLSVHAGDKWFPFIPLFKPERQKYMGGCSRCTTQRAKETLKYLKKDNPYWPYDEPWGEVNE